LSSKVETPCSVIGVATVTKAGRRRIAATFRVIFRYRLSTLRFRNDEGWAVPVLDSTATQAASKFPLLFTHHDEKVAAF
jgi:hypothetical protein